MERVLNFSSCCIACQDFIKAEPTDSLKTPVRQLVMTTCANLMYPLNKTLSRTWNGITENKASCK